jgi:transcriptional regulator with XRE-family HTH domain
MASDLDIRLRAERAFIQYLCVATGESASALAAGSGMAATTLNRFLSKKIKLKSTLKDSTIQKIAERWGFDYLELLGYRKKIEDALRDGRAIPDFQKTRFRSSETRIGGLKEAPGRSFAAPERDPLMDQIMGATYEVWFHSDYRDVVDFSRLPELVRLLYGRARSEPKTPAANEIKKRAADMLAVAAMKKVGKK